ncbi:hypothetical protein [Siminovitchia fortis]|uniref:hypothetical protein n=1 Tax=Siminovitchia fortis TaxID=254758 RepID=UPI001642620A|nr:hypothetical protein [Siminovitchia fortis]
MPSSAIGLILAPMAPEAGHYVNLVQTENSVKFYAFFSFEEKTVVKKELAT